MRLEFIDADDSLWSSIRATPTDFDAFPPVPEFRVQWTLQGASADRTAVAASLIFSPWIAGRCDHLRPFSALTEQRIVEWFAEQGVWVAPTPVRAGGLPIPRGSTRLWLSGDPVEPGDASLGLVPPPGGSGQIEGAIRLASNFSFLAQSASTAAQAFAIRVGVATLVAESLSVDQLIDPIFYRSHRKEFFAVQRLLECVSIGLRYE